MSRSSNLIILGSLSTLTSTLVVSQTLLPAQLLVDTAYFLATTLILCACLPLVAGVIDSQPLRLLSFAVYTFMPVGWGLLLVSGNELQMTLPFWLSLTLCGFIGGAICDRGAELLTFQQMRYAHQASSDSWTSGKFLRPIVEAYDSGRLSRPNLLATDSGAFQSPRIR